MLIHIFFMQGLYYLEIRAQFTKKQSSAIASNFGQERLLLVITDSPKTSNLDSLLHVAFAITQLRYINSKMSTVGENLTANIIIEICTAVNSQKSYHYQ